MRLITAAIAIVVAVGVLAPILFFYLQGPAVISYSSQQQVSKYVTEFSTSSNSTQPSGIAVDSEGNVWFTLENHSALAELTPSTGKIQEFKIPIREKASTVTWPMTVDNSRGTVWFTDQTSNSIWSFDMITHKFKEYKLQTPNCFPFGIAVDRQGNIWFTEFFGNKIGEIAANGSIYEFTIPISGSLEPSAIVADLTGKVWFTLSGINSIGSFSNGKFGSVNLTGLVDTPAGIAIDPQGNLWMTEHGPSFISEYNPMTHYFEQISTVVPPYGTSLPYFIYTIGDGAIWFNEHEGNAESVFFPKNNTMIEYYIPTEISFAGNISGALTSNVSPSGAPWYAEFFSGKVGTVNTKTPIDIHLELSNYTHPLVMGPEDESTLKIVLSGSAASNAKLEETVGNLSSNLSFKFNSLSHALTIQGNSTKPGVYFVTISGVTKSLALSQVVEVQVKS